MYGHQASKETLNKARFQTQKLIRFLTELSYLRQCLDDKLLLLDNDKEHLERIERALAYFDDYRLKSLIFQLRSRKTKSIETVLELNKCIKPLLSEEAVLTLVRDYILHQQNNAKKYQLYLVRYQLEELLKKESTEFECYIQVIISNLGNLSEIYNDLEKDKKFEDNFFSALRSFFKLSFRLISGIYLGCSGILIFQYLNHIDSLNLLVQLNINHLLAMIFPFGFYTVLLPVLAFALSYSVVMLLANFLDVLKRRDDCFLTVLLLFVIVFSPLLTVLVNTKVFDLDYWLWCSGNFGFLYFLYVSIFILIMLPNLDIEHSQRVQTGIYIVRSFSGMLWGIMILFIVSNGTFFSKIFMESTGIYQKHNSLYRIKATMVVFPPPEKSQTLADGGMIVCGRNVLDLDKVMVFLPYGSNEVQTANNPTAEAQKFYQIGKAFIQPYYGKSDIDCR